LLAFKYNSSGAHLGVKLSDIGAIRDAYEGGIMDSLVQPGSIACVFQFLPEIWMAPGEKEPMKMLRSMFDGRWNRM
jgi:hypothetical protein